MWLEKHRTPSLKVNIWLVMQMLIFFFLVPKNDALLSSFKIMFTCFVTSRDEYSEQEDMRIILHLISIVLNMYRNSSEGGYAYIFLTLFS